MPKSERVLRHHWSDVFQIGRGSPLTDGEEHVQSFDSQVGYESDGDCVFLLELGVRQWVWGERWEEQEVWEVEEERHHLLRYRDHHVYQAKQKECGYG
mmetsp:Transcript_4739/g.13286  ORF Transcript_4739/g.13286 Transcript_4739/m.13286 type:complete len:98 (+) Transcript_4739:3026-3319(+)